MSIKKEDINKSPIKQGKNAVMLKTFQSEMEKGVISKIDTKNSKEPVYLNKKGQTVNSNGELLTKRGKLDKRAENKSGGDIFTKRWKEIAEMNKTKNKVVATVESDSDSEPDFEIELIEPVKPVEHVKLVEPVIVPIQPSQTELFLKKEEDKRIKFDEELSKLRSENANLKSGLHFNDHLNRISHMAKSVKMKF
jgi:hypothetical protein